MIFFSDPDPTWPQFQIRIVYEKYFEMQIILTLQKEQILLNLYILGSGLFRKIYLNCRSSKHCEKTIFFFF
jgi:hypothetical protein